MYVAFKMDSLCNDLTHFQGYFLSLTSIGHKEIIAWWWRASIFKIGPRDKKNRETTTQKIVEIGALTIFFGGFLGENNSLLWPNFVIMGLHESSNTFSQHSTS